MSEKSHSALESPCVVTSSSGLSGNLETTRFCSVNVKFGGPHRHGLSSVVVLPTLQSTAMLSDIAAVLASAETLTANTSLMLFPGIAQPTLLEGSSYCDAPNSFVDNSRCFERRRHARKISTDRTHKKIGEALPIILPVCDGRLGAGIATSLEGCDEGGCDEGGGTFRGDEDRTNMSARSGSRLTASAPGIFCEDTQEN